MMTTLEAAARFGLPRCPAAVLARLSRTPGVIVDHGALQTALEDETGNGWSMDAVRKPVAAARRAIAGRGEIKTWHGMGYMLVWND